jgi:hypothetical protein
MVQGCENLRLPPEARKALGVGREGLGNDLERHVTTECRVAGSIDLAHTALADEGDDFIRTESSAGCERHGKVELGLSPKTTDAFDETNEGPLASPG